MVYLAVVKKGDPMVVVSSLTCSLYRAIEEKSQAVIADTSLFDTVETSRRLKKYPLSLFESGAEYTRTAFFYGKGSKVLDLTDKVPSKIPIQYDLNLIAGNPSQQSNEIFMAYTLNGVEFTETYSESRNSTIYTDLNQLPPHTDFFWLDKAKLELYDSILKSLTWKTSGSKKGTHLIHVLSPTEVKETLYPSLLNKYKEILTAHVPAKDPLVLLHTNPDLEIFLKEKGYSYTVLDTSDPVSFASAIQCTGSFVGNFNLENLTGSFTSYYLHVVSSCKQSILIDLDNLSEN